MSTKLYWVHAEFTEHVDRQGCESFRLQIEARVLCLCCQSTFDVDSGGHEIPGIVDALDRDYLEDALWDEARYLKSELKKMGVQDLWKFWTEAAKAINEVDLIGGD